MRIHEIERNTAETKIKIKLNIDGSGKYKMQNIVKCQKSDT